MTTRKQVTKKTKPAHPDLGAGLERLGLPHDPEWLGDKRQHPTYHEVLAELLVKKVPA